MNIRKKTQITLGFLAFICPFYSFGFSVAKVEILPKEKEAVFDCDGTVIPGYRTASLSVESDMIDDLPLTEEAGDLLCFSTMNMSQEENIIITLRKEVENIEIRVKLQNKITSKHFYLENRAAGMAKRRSTFPSVILKFLPNTTCTYEAQFGEIKFTLDASEELHRHLQQDRSAFVRFSFTSTRDNIPTGMGDRDLFIKLVDEQ